ncbi:MAG: substrate-binding domain-containing protein [Planctomycetota bacterium]
MPSPKQVALLIETATITGRTILRGIGRFLQTRQTWQCFIAPGMSDRFPAGLGDWRGDGVLATVSTKQLADELLQRDLTGLLDESPFPRVLADDRQVGRLAAEDFLQRGHRNFGYFGVPDERYSRLRQAGYVDRLAEEGFAVSINRKDPLQGRNDWRWWRRQTESWLGSLQFPVAVLACNDNQGRTLTNVCNNLGIRIPEDISLIGVDNDEAMCDLCHPPLSSVEEDDEVRGFQAAVMLQQMMDGQPPEPRELTIAPRSVVTRPSSELLAVDDPEVADALRFIRSHAGSPIRVADILRHVPISRSSLEKRFVRAIGRLPAEEIRRVHLSRAKQLLARSDMTMAEVARRSGFASAKSLSDIFSRHEGITASEFRRQHMIR